MSFAVVLVGGAIPDRGIIERLGSPDSVIAADGGIRIARAHELPVDAVVGDLDSIAAEDLAWAKASGAMIVEYPSNKDATDLELALEYADNAGVERIAAIGVGGGRLDHELGNWSVLCAARSARVEVHSTSGHVTILHGGSHDSVTLRAGRGELVSLLPRFGDAHGVTTTGLRWELDDEVLGAASARGVSNEFLGTQATVALARGTLMVVRPRGCA